MDKKWIVRILCGILAAVMLLGIIPFGAFAEENDNTTPSLTSLTLSTTTITPPGTIEMVATATGGTSGLDYVTLYFRREGTDESHIVKLERTYYNEQTHQKEEYADGKVHGSITFDLHAKPGVFTLYTIEVTEKSGNTRPYYENWEEYAFPDFAKGLQFTVTETGVADPTLPAIKSLMLSTTSVAISETVEVVAEVFDEQSEVFGVYVAFRCDETGSMVDGHLSRSYYDESAEKWVDYPDGKFHGTCQVVGSLFLGDKERYVLELKELDIYYSSNYGRYYRAEIENEEQEPLPDFVKGLCLTVTKNPKSDFKPPVLKSIEISKLSVKAPGLVEIIAEATDDISGVAYADALLVNENNEIAVRLEKTYFDKETGKRVDYPDGRLHGTLIVDQYVKTGIFSIRNIYLFDVSGNQMCYVKSLHEEGSSQKYLPSFAMDLRLHVLNEVADVVTSVSEEYFVEEIMNAPNEAYISVDYSGNTSVPQETFDAIAGTNKTLDLTSEGITWRFQGQDIVNESKSIDLAVAIMPITEELLETEHEIQEELPSENAYVIKFGENGVLPGKATVQIKVDYAMRQYLGSDNDLCIYYYNNETGELELVAKDLTVIGDTYVEFEISHCSYYVLSKDLNLDRMIRLAGADRFATAFKVADRMKQNLGGGKFDTIIVASGADFADALSGSYLAAMKNAPILLSYKEKQNKLVQSYIRENLEEGGKVYILGGAKAVPDSLQKGLEGLNVVRLAGENRFETNLKILEEAGIPAGEEVLVCTGTSFADCLSASATGKPILLTYKKLTDSQAGYLQTLSGNTFCIIGGENAVNQDVAAAVGAYGTTSRLAGAHRYETSVLVAKKYFENPESAVLAYAKNYPDGLCGGALAVTVNAPLILTDSKYWPYAAEYAGGVERGIVLGGTGLISDGAVCNIFKVNADMVIVNK